MEGIQEQYDELLEDVETLIDNLKALQTDIINASESDSLTMEVQEELDWMYATIDFAVRLAEEIGQAMVQ